MLQGLYFDLLYAVAGIPLYHWLFFFVEIRILLVNAFDVVDQPGL